MDSSEAKQQLSTLYKDKIAEPLQAVIDDTNKFLARAEALPAELKRETIAPLTKETVEIRGNKESFVPLDTLPAIPSFARHAQDLQGFFKAVSGEKAELTEREKTAATLRWEPFDQLTHAMYAMQPSLVNVDKELAQNARAITDNAEKVQKAMGGRELDTLFLAAAETPYATQAVSVDTLKTRIATPLENIVTKAAKLNEQLAALDPFDKERVVAMTPSYQKQSTLNGLIADDLIASLPELTKNVQGLQSVLEAVTSPKTRELTDNEKRVTATPWDATDALRMPVRALHAMLNALNVPEKGGVFRSDNLTAPGKYDSLLALAADVSSGCWEVQKALHPQLSPGAMQGLQDAVKVYSETAITHPPTAIENASAAPVNPGKDRGLT